MQSYRNFLSTNGRLICFGVLASFSSAFGQTFFISLFGAEIREAFTLSHGDFGAVYSAGTLASAGFLIWTGKMIDHVDLRVYMVAICLGLAAACIGMSLAGSVAVLVGVVFCLRQFGQGLLSHTSSTTMARYVYPGRGKAVGLAALGFPLGEAVFPTIAVAMVFAVGWRQTWLFCAAFIVVVLVPVALYLLRGHVDRVRAYEQRLEREEQTRIASGLSLMTDWTRAQVLRDRRFYLALPAILAPSFVFTGLFFHQVYLVELQGWTMESLAASYFAYSAATIGASVAGGWLIDRVGAVRLLPWFLLPLIGAISVLIVGGSSWTVWPYMVLVGLNAGMSHALFSAIWAEIYGTRYLGSLKAMSSALMVFSSALSPFLLGVFFDLGADMITLCLGLMAYLLFTILLATVAMRGYLAAGLGGPAPA